MKRILCGMLVCILLLGSVCVQAQESEFTVLRVPYAAEEAAAVGKTWELAGRYVDDKTPIPLSMYYDGHLFATVPTENTSREIELYVPEKMTFTDEDGGVDMYVMRELSAYGIINGNDKGEALPYANITRAEATAMVLRFMGLSAGENTDSGFADVAPTDWYAPIVTAAKSYGVVQGDSETIFSPKRQVSREEMTVMLARAIWCIGLRNAPTDATAASIAESQNLTDAESISPWAYNAYATMATYNIFDTVETDELDAEGIPIYVFKANPQQAATRAEVARMIGNARDSFQIYPSQRAIEFGFDVKMPIVDGSTSTYPFTQAVYRRLFSNGYLHADMPAKHSKSHATYQRLINGEIDMMFASVYPASDILAMAEEKGVELELIPIAYDAMIFFTNANNSIEGLTTEQISNIYVNNAYANWKEVGGPDALLYPYCRNQDSGSHAQMERHFLNGSQIHEKIRQETTSITMANVLTDVMGAQTENPTGYGLGYSIYYYFHNMDMFYNTSRELKLLAIDGVHPTDDTIADGSYPLSNNTYVVLRKDTPEDHPARRMAAFMLTAEGQACVEEAGFGKLKVGN